MTRAARHHNPRSAHAVSVLTARNAFLLARLDVMGNGVIRCALSTILQRMLRQAGLVASIGAALLLAGCASKAGPSSISATPAPASSRSAGAAAPAATATPSPAATETIPDHYDPARNPAADLQAALASAATDHKEVLIDFGADWCPDCQVLDKLFESGQTNPLLQRDYHVVAVDVGQFDHNVSFTAKYVNLKTSGIPALVVLTAGGKIRFATNDGSFENARTMNNQQVNAFLTRWAPAG